MPSTETSCAPFILKFSAFYSNDVAAKQRLVDHVQDCCLHNGFSQITGHSIPAELWDGIMTWHKKFFDLWLEGKVKVGNDTSNTWNISRLAL